MIRTYILHILFLLAPCNLCAMATDLQDPNQRLIDCAMRDDVEDIDRALTVEGATFEPVNGCTALEVAARKDNCEAAVTLLRRGAPLSTDVLFNVITGFGITCQESLDIVKYFSYSRLISALLERIGEDPCAVKPFTLEHIFWMAGEDNCGDEVLKIFRKYVFPNMLSRRTRREKYSRKLTRNKVRQKDSRNILSLLMMRQLNGSNPTFCSKY